MISCETSQKAHCDKKTLKANGNKEDLEADIARHSSIFETVVSISITLDGEIFGVESELGVLSNRLRMDTVCTRKDVLFHQQREP